MTDTVITLVPSGGTRKDPIQAAREHHVRRKEAIAARWDPRVDAAKERRDRAAADWDVIYGDEDRFPRYWNPYLYMFLMLLLTVAEAPINRLSFELFFSESPLISLSVSLVVGATLVFLAHVTGTVARRFRHSCTKSGGVWVALGQLTVTLVLIGVLVYGIAILRQGYLAFLTQPDPSFGALMEDQQVIQAAMLVLQTTLGPEGLIFLFINLGIVAVGVLAAFFCHDPHPDYERIDCAKKRTQIELDAIIAKRADLYAQELRRFDANLQRI